MNIQHKKIGIWGFGVVGKSAALFLQKQGAFITVMDKKALSLDESTLLASLGIEYLQQTAQTIERFWHDNNMILASPGIDLRPYSTFDYKIISELDIFASWWKKKIVAITGSIGKTSVTHLLTSLLQASNGRWISAGNIGIGMLDIIEFQELYDGVVLEVSSFQLEHCHSFAPELAIWTNLYPNHLDRHSTVRQYGLAKSMIIAHQKKDQHALLPISLLDNEDIRRIVNKRANTVTFFSRTKPTTIPHTIKRLLWLQDDAIMFYDAGCVREIGSLANISLPTYQENLLIIGAAMHLLNIPMPKIDTMELDQKPLAHRLELVATIDKVPFYNDSKSTVPEATIAALERFKNKSIILFVGGVSKGVDRTQFIAHLKTTSVKFLIAFGKEADFIKQVAQAHSLACFASPTLEEAFAQVAKQYTDSDVVLFSPAGASFDLFANYQERGNRFKQLVEQFKITQEG